jgi:SAM-dependent methyltransferase
LCDAVWINPSPRPTEIALFYQDYYTHTENVKEHRFLRHIYPHPIAARAAKARLGQPIPKGIPTGSVLEVGCGNGEKLAQLQKMGWKVTGQEIDPVAADLASKRSGANVLVGPLESCDFAGETFDLVLSSHVIEHVFDPIAFLETIRSLTSRGGASIHYTPNTRSLSYLVTRSYWRGLEPPRHLVLLGPKSARACFLAAGFVDIQISTRGAGGGNVIAASIAPHSKGAFGRALTLAGQLLEDASFLLGRNRHWEMLVVATSPSGPV